MSFDITTLVTDRTQADVARVQEVAEKIIDGTASEAEIAEWNAAAMKGAYNYTDLNRVGAAMCYVVEKMKPFGFLVEVSPRQDWTQSEIPTPAEMAKYLSDLETIRSALPVMPSTPAVPADMEQLTVEEANGIEKILDHIDLLLNNIVAAWIYSGETYSGEV